MKDDRGIVRVNKRLQVGLLIWISICVLSACGGNAGNTENTGNMGEQGQFGTEIADNERGSIEKLPENVETEEPTTDGGEMEDSSTEDVTTETPSTEKPSTEKPSTEKPSTEQPSTETPSTEKPSTEKPSTEKPSTETPSAETQPTQTELSALVKKIVAEIITSGMSELEKALVIHDYITYNIDYDYENYLNNAIPGASHTAYGALTTKRAVCDGYAEAYYWLAKEAGLNVKFIGGAADNGSGNGYEGHAWNQVRVDGVWYNLDSCWGDPTYEGKNASDHSQNNHSYCLISDDVMYKDHRADSNTVEKCPKSMSPAKLAEALAKVNKYEEMVYIASEAELDRKIKNMVAAGKEEFVVLLVEDGTDYWQRITDVLTSTKKPLWIKSGNLANEIQRYNVEMKEDVRCVETVAEIKKALDEYKGRWDKLELWYYNDAINEENASSLVNEMLYRTGHVVEVYSMTEVRVGHVRCMLEVPENVMLVDDVDELVTFAKKNGINALQSKYIWYKTDALDLYKLQDAMREEFITEGIFIEQIDDFRGGSYADVIKFHVTKTRQVTYIKDSQALAEYVKKTGLNGLSDRDIYTLKKNSKETAYNALNDFFVQAQLPVQFAYCEYNNVLCASDISVIVNVYISSDTQDLKNDINDAISKGVLEEVEFWVIDKTGQYDEADIRAMVKATGCGVTMDSFWTREGQYHSLRIRAL